MPVGRIRFLVVCWTGGLGSSLAVGWRPSEVPCYVGLYRAAYNMTASSTRVSKLERRKRKVPVFCDLILELTSYYLCHILFVRSNPRGLAHTQGGGYYKRVWIPGGQSIGTILIGNLPHPLFTAEETKA